jgi:uncharacterized membrane protein
MDQIKAALQSKTVWAGIIGVVLWLLQLFHVDVSGLGIDPNGMADKVIEVVGVLMSLFAIFGRVTATSTISGVVTPKTDTTTTDVK